jgi:DNA-binding MarR family transcriptional regulator
MRLIAKILPKQESIEQIERQYPDFKVQYFEAIQTLFVLSNDLERNMEQYLSGRCPGFSRARFLILMVLIYHEGQRTQPNEIAKKLNVTRGNMTGLIDNLVSEGFVTKYQDEVDRRQVWIEVTTSGRKLLEKILPGHFKRISKFMGVLKRDEVAMLLKLLSKLSAGMPEAFGESEV